MSPTALDVYPGELARELRRRGLVEFRIPAHAIAKATGPGSFAMLVILAFPMAGA
jgi:hypothetical protein